VNITIIHNPDEANAITHSAPHHADEVFATVLLSMFQDVKLIRTRDQQLIEKIIDSQATSKDFYVYDVGKVYDPTRRLFDHHQKDDARQLFRPVGIRYSSAGLIWRECSWLILKRFSLPPLIQDQVARIVYQKLILHIDACDNGQSADYNNGMCVSDVIESFNVCWDEDSNDDDAFLKACEVAYDILLRVIQNAISAVNGIPIVEAAISKSEHRIMVMEQAIDNWQEIVTNSANIKARDLFYCVFQGKAGHWNIQAIPSSQQDKWSQRKPFPESWRGLAGDDLAEVTGVKTALFCHPGGFFASAKVKEDAIIMAKLATVTP